MEDKEREQKLDQWLDQALSDYSSAEPRFGLEQRVLNRLQAETRPRRWNLWRWMPAFAAIAAAVIVAVAIRPVTMRNQLINKAQVDMTSGQLKTYSQPASAESDRDKLSSSDSVPSKKAIEVTRAPIHKSLVVRQKQPASSIQVETDSGQNFVAGRREGAFQAAPALPPPPPESGAAVGGLIYTAPAAPALGRTYRQLEPAQKQAGAESYPSQLDRQTSDHLVAHNDMDTYESMHLSPGVAAKMPESKPREAHATPPADTSFDVFGVKVRSGKIVNAPIGPMQQFPTPAPLSQQERLAVAAGEKLKDKAVTKETDGNIPKIEIKDVVIAPLEAPEK